MAWDPDALRLVLVHSWNWIDANDFSAAVDWSWSGHDWSWSDSVCDRAAKDYAACDSSASDKRWAYVDVVRPVVVDRRTPTLVDSTSMSMRHRTDAMAWTCSCCQSKCCAQYHCKYLLHLSYSFLLLFTVQTSLTSVSSSNQRMSVARAWLSLARPFSALPAANSGS